MEEQYRAPRGNDSADQRASSETAAGFCVKGGPWEKSKGHQVMPDTNDAEEFPSFGANDQPTPALASEPVAAADVAETPRLWGPKGAGR